MYKGSCLCGKVQFQITGPIRNIVCCHCSECRRAQGSAFATNGNVEAKHFHFIQGEDEMTGYESTPGQTKYFCRRCGAPIISRRVADPGNVRVRVGSITSDIEERPLAHIFVASKANWEEIGGDLPHYDEYEPSR